MYRTATELLQLIANPTACNAEPVMDAGDIRSYADLVAKVSDGMLFVFDMDHYDSRARLLNPVGIHWLKARALLEQAEQELRLAEYEALKQPNPHHGA